MRINARIDKESEAQLRRVQARTGWRTTEVIKRGLALLDHQTSVGRSRPVDIAANVGLIGLAEGDADLSSDYKERMREGLESKHS